MVFFSAESFLFGIYGKTKELLGKSNFIIIIHIIILNFISLLNNFDKYENIRDNSNFFHHLQIIFMQLHNLGSIKKFSELL